MINGVPIEYFILLSATLFVIGAIGVMARRNSIIIFMCIELMLNAVNILLTAFSAYHQNADGQVMVFFVMTVAAAEVAVGLAILTMIFKNIRSIDTNLLSNLKD